LIARIMKFPDGERRVTNLLHLSEVLNDAANRYRFGASGLLKWLAERRLNVDRTVEEHQLRLESDANAVTILTMHMSKGLEFPIVFSPFNWGGSTIWSADSLEFHSPENGEFFLDLGSDSWDQNRDLAEKEKLAENLRLLYVAVTRAKHKCYLVWGPLSGAITSALAYLLHRPIPFEERRPVEALKQFCKSLKGPDFRNELEKLAANSNGAIKVLDLPEVMERKTELASSRPTDLYCRTFETRIDTATRISSYSSMVAKQQHSEERADHDLITATLPQIKFLADEDVSLQHFRFFPRGPKTGLFVHELLENIDFKTPDSAETERQIQRLLDSYDFDLQWQNAIAKMLNDLCGLGLNFGDQNFSLSQISKDKRLNEIEFYFPLKTLESEKISRIFSEHEIPGFGTKFSEKLTTLNFAPFKGFMKGFIDLVFEHAGKFYIVDWKSNFLGYSPEDYSEENLQTAMLDNFYILQYHLYAVALDQYLKLRLPDYSYEKHFGGVFYFFLRGVAPDSSNGIFQNRPSKKLLEDLNNTLLEVSALT